MGQNPIQEDSAQTMFDHEIARTGADVQPRWLRIPAAIAYSGLPRSSLYRLLSQKVIKSASLCSPGKFRGVRIVDRLELDALLSKLTNQNAAQKKEAPTVKPTRRKPARSAKA
jgi:hypothetical protein